LRSSALKIELAEIQEIECSGDRPPKSTAIFILPMNKSYSFSAVIG